MDNTQRILSLIAEIQAFLSNMATEVVLKGSISGNELKAIESTLLQYTRWRPVMRLTGPSGYDPHPVYEKCDSCGHYRIP
jgi:hypothetical protein